MNAPKQAKYRGGLQTWPKAPPSSTAVQISKLARDAAEFEVEAIAVVPEG
jgi:enamine deaminase RidA (YjgF/YER057c/UK114 family)